MTLLHRRELEVTEGTDVRRLRQAAKVRFGRFDVLVNNAGVMPLLPLAALQFNKCKRLVDVNIPGVFNGIAAVLPWFVAQRSGHIINVASVAVHMVIPNAAVYCATKHAVRAINEG